MPKNLIPEIFLLFWDQFYKDLSKDHDQDQKWSRRYQYFHNYFPKAIFSSKAELHQIWVLEIFWPMLHKWYWKYIIFYSHDGGWSSYSSPVSVGSFVKSISLVKVKFIKIKILRKIILMAFSLPRAKFWRLLFVLKRPKQRNVFWP